MLNWLDAHFDTLLCIGTFCVFGLTAHLMRGSL